MPWFRHEEDDESQNDEDGAANLDPAVDDATETPVNSWREVQVKRERERNAIIILCLIPRTTVTSLSALHAARHIVYASIPMFLFERVIKLCTR